MKVSKIDILAIIETTLATGLKLRNSCFVVQSCSNAVINKVNQVSNYSQSTPPRDRFEHRQRDFRVPVEIFLIC